MKSDVEFVDEGIRERFDIMDDGQSWYVILTPKSVFVTVPHENRRDMRDIRVAVDKICEAVSTMMEKRHEENIITDTVVSSSAGDGAADYNI